MKDWIQSGCAALSPAKNLRVEINEETKTANVFVAKDELSLAIGKEGQNARLASKLTGYRIEIQPEIGSEEPVVEEKVEEVEKTEEVAEVKTEGSEEPVVEEQTEKSEAVETPEEAPSNE